MPQLREFRSIYNCFLTLTKTFYRRKRFKRFFEKDEEPIHFHGNTLGRSEDGGADSKTPRTPKPKATKPVSSDDGKEIQSNSKKRSSAEAEVGEDAPDSNGGKCSTF